MYIIRNAESKTVSYLSKIEVFNAEARATAHKLEWTKYPLLAIGLENREEAEAVIEFISNVLDWELAECLEAEYVVK